MPNFRGNSKDFEVWRKAAYDRGPRSAHSMVNGREDLHTFCAFSRKLSLLPVYHKTTQKATETTARGESKLLTR